MTATAQQIETSPNLQGIELPEHVFDNPAEFIQAVHTGLPGKVIRQAINTVGHRELFVSILGVQSSNLSRLYKRKRLDKVNSESILDLLRLIHEAFRVFEDSDKANEWLETPVPALGNAAPLDLCDTFEGRELVRSALRKIEYGEFS